MRSRFRSPYIFLPVVMAERIERRGMRGQVVPVVAVLALVLAAFVILVINGGDLVSHRMRAQNAADAVALTTATWDARGLNVVAMVNVMAALMATALVVAKSIEWLVIFCLFVSYPVAVDRCCDHFIPRPCCFKVVPEGWPLVRMFQKTLDGFDAARDTLEDVSNGLMEASLSSSSRLHQTGLQVSVSSRMARDNGVDSQRVVGPLMTASAKLPISRGSRGQLVKAVLRGRIGGFDEGEAEDILEGSGRRMRDLISRLQRRSSSFNKDDTGPAQGWRNPFDVDLWTPYFLTVGKLFSRAPVTMTKGYGFAWAATVPLLETEELLGNLSDLMPTRPYVLSDGWASKLSYLGVAKEKRSSITAPFLSSAFRNSRAGRRGEYAVAQSQVYNPYHGVNRTPDVFTPQFRARLVPCAGSAMNPYLRQDPALAELAGAWALCKH